MTWITVKHNYLLIELLCSIILCLFKLYTLGKEWLLRWLSYVSIKYIFNREQMIGISIKMLSMDSVKILFEFPTGQTSAFRVRCRFYLNIINIIKSIAADSLNQLFSGRKCSSTFYRDLSTRRPLKLMRPYAIRLYRAPSRFYRSLDPYRLYGLGLHFVQF